ncbi:TolC family protein [Guyparkeria hydrothermalis]|uniref:TolC family protein n=1 Tax=Guyparkeria TaxID=2035712 RepID=UPI0010AD79A7|nr:MULTISPECIES: TolC family protein [Guyparkeria]MCL7750030.1 TolC family protein [Guyparkeria hydrothermalis]TKA89768.1 TolC family protein [Guyparkeria sp. SB14A]
MNKRDGFIEWGGALLLTAALAGLASTTVRAETPPGEPITLEQATDMALHADPRIEEQRANVARAQALIERVKGEGGVRVSANLFMGLAPKAEDGIFTNGTNTCPAGESCTLRDDGNELDEGLTVTSGLTASIIQPLYTFGKLENYGNAARLNRDVKASEVALARGETWLTVRRAYWGYLAARDTRRMLEGVKRQVDRTREDMREDAQAGEVPMSQLYALESGAAQLERYLAEAGSVEAIAIDGLKTIIGVPITSSIEVADPRIEPVTLPEGGLAELADRALAQRPEMAMAENGQAAMRNYVAARKSERYPNLYAGVIAGATYTPGRDRLNNPYINQPLNQAYAAPVVGLQWDFNPGVMRANVSDAEAQLQGVVAKAQLARQGIPFQVAEAYHTAHGLERQIRALDAAKGNTRKWMVSTFMDYQAGLVGGEELAEAVKANTEAQADYFRAINDFNMSVAQLAIATGDYPQ